MKKAKELLTTKDRVRLAELQLKKKQGQKLSMKEDVLLDLLLELQLEEQGQPPLNNITDNDRNTNYN